MTKKLSTRQTFKSLLFWFNVIVIYLVFLSSALLSADGWGQAPRTAKIAFSSIRDGNAEIYVMDIDGKNPHNLTNHRSSDMMLAWSPDGRRIAFYSSRSDGTGLYLMDADGKNPRFLVTTADCCEPNPAWSPDGKQIAFESSRKNGKTDIYVITQMRRIDAG